MATNERTRAPRESAVRSRARRMGYLLRKSRQRTNVPNADNHGEYMLVEANRNFVVLGGRFDATLQDISTFLDELAG